MYSTYSEGKPVDAERFIRTFKNKISHPATRRRGDVIMTSLCMSQ